MLPWKKLMFGSLKRHFLHCGGTGKKYIGLTVNNQPLPMSNVDFRILDNLARWET
jgi:hypothetical protein